MLEGYVEPAEGPIYRGELGIGAPLKTRKKSQPRCKPSRGWVRESKRLVSKDVADDESDTSSFESSVKYNSSDGGRTRAYASNVEQVMLTSLNSDSRRFYRRCTDTSNV